MKKLMALLLTVCLFGASFVACSGTNTTAPGKAADTGKAEVRELNLYTWAGVFPEEVLADFTKETGIRVNYSNFDTDESMLAKLQSDTAGSYDLVIADDYIIKTVIAEGLAQPLDTAQLSNIANVNPLYQNQFFDPQNEYTVPYGAGVQTIVYNAQKVGFDIKGYEDLWNPELKNKVGIIGNSRVIIGMALKTMGESYNTEDVAKIKQAGERLQELSPNIRTITDDNLQDKLIAGEIDAAIMYTSQVTLAKIYKPELSVVFPKEGIGFGVMANFIPTNAQHTAEAHEFINYILQPKVAAKCFEYFGYYCTNQAAETYISPEYKEFLTLPESFNQNMEMIQPISADAENALQLVWTEFLAAH